MKNAKIKTFIHELFGELREFEDAAGDIWFSAVDAYKALGLDHKALQRIQPEDKLPNAFPAERSNRHSTGVSLAGLFMLVLASRKKEALQYKHWVTHEVLPAIYKDGGYILGQENLPAAERASLEEKVRNLAAEVERANAGKAKLQSYLIAEEDRNFALADLLADAARNLANAEKKLADLAGSLMDPEQVRAYLSRIEHVQQMEACAQKIRAAEKEAADVESRIPYAKKVEPEVDPMVRDKFGHVMRRSEYLAGLA